MTKNTWQNRIVGYGEEAPDQLLANPANWRTHPRHQTDALAGVLREVGLVQTVIVNRTTGYVVDGHARIALALRDGQPSVPVTYNVKPANVPISVRRVTLMDIGTSLLGFGHASGRSSGAGASC